MFLAGLGSNWWKHVEHILMVLAMSIVFVDQWLARQQGSSNQPTPARAVVWSRTEVNLLSLKHCSSAWRAFWLCRRGPTPARFPLMKLKNRLRCWSWNRRNFIVRNDIGGSVLKDKQTQTRHPTFACAVQGRCVSRTKSSLKWYSKAGATL